MLAGRIEAQSVATAAALAGWGVADVWQIPHDDRTAFDAALVAEPKPESETDRLRRELGI